MTRMRLLDEIIPELKAIDPKTPITRNAVRKWGLSGKIPTIMVGRKRIYSLDGLLEFLDSQTAEPTEPEHGIRPVSEKM